MVVFPALCVAATARTFYPPAAQLATHPALLAEAELPRAALRGAPVSAYAAGSSEASETLPSLAVFGVGCAAGYALLSVAGARAQSGARRRSAGAVMQARLEDDPETMITKGGQYMYDQPFAPPTMGREYIQADVRKPLSEYVGASAEFNLGKWFAGEKEETFEPWDPLNLCLLSKVPRTTRTSRSSARPSSSTGASLCWPSSAFSSLRAARTSRPRNSKRRRRWAGPKLSAPLTKATPAFWRRPSPPSPSWRGSPTRTAARPGGSTGGTGSGSASGRAAP